MSALVPGPLFLVQLVSRSEGQSLDTSPPSEQLPPLEVPIPLSVVVEAPTSLIITIDNRIERAMPHTWTVLDSTTTVDAALNVLSQDGGGSITEGSERLQQVSDDRLNVRRA